MDNEQELIGQIGLILTQLRYTRRAVEDIERSTARYGSIDFTAAFAAGSRFGEPPLIGGALKVYVVNINDLTTGGGIGSFFESLLGGVGRFFGGLFGGLIGGTISGIALPVIVTQLARLMESLERVANTVDQIVTTIKQVAEIFKPEKPQKTPAGALETKGAQQAEAGGLSTIEIIRALTDLFSASASGPGGTTKEVGTVPPEADSQWKSISALLTGIDRVVQGLIITLPMLLGTLSWFITHFDNIKKAIVDLLQFAIRNVFLLRGVTLVTIYDTGSAVASLAASLLGIIKEMVVRIVDSVFRIIGDLLNAALEVFRFISDGLQRTVDSLLDWLVNVLAAVLTFIGDLRIFRTIVHVIDMLPKLIPALYQLFHGEPMDLSGETGKWLREAASTPFPGTSGATSPASVPIPKFPSIAETMFPKEATDKLRQTLVDTGKSLSSEVGNIAGTAQKGLNDASKTLDQAATSSTKNFGDTITTQLQEMQKHADTLSKSLVQGQDTGTKPKTGLEVIANTYEKWLTGGGLTIVLGTITNFFRQTATTGPEGTESLMGRIAQLFMGTPAEAPRATIDIQEVLITIEPPAGAAGTQPTSSVDLIGDAMVADLMQRMYERGLEYQQRDSRFVPGLPLA